MAGHDASEWAGATGDRWLEHIVRFEGMLAEIGDALIAYAEFKEGEHVVDAGCGCGPTTLAIAREVGPKAIVTGIDIGPKLIALAQQRAADCGLSNLRFELMDGETGQPVDAPFDRLFSRFGVMFFKDSQIAFRNMRSWLKPGGRIDIAVWGAPERNPWFGAVGGVMAAHFDLPAPEPDSPGPFRLSDIESTTALLKSAGFTDISVTEHVAFQPFGGPGTTPKQGIEFVLKALDMQKLLDGAGPETASVVRRELEAVFAANHNDTGVMMEGCSLFFSARA